MTEEKKKKLRNRAMNLTYISAKSIMNELLPQTSFESSRLLRVYEADNETIKSIIIYLDDACRISVSDYFICAVRTDKKKKIKYKSIAFPKCKDLESDLKRALTELGFLD